MNEKYVYLMHAGHEICKLSQQRLKEAGIDSQLEDYSQNAFFRLYGAGSLIGKKISVPEAKLAEAKELLNISKEEHDSYSFSASKRTMHRITKILIIISLFIFLLLFIGGFLNNLNIFLNS